MKSVLIETITTAIILFFLDSLQKLIHFDYGLTVLVISLSIYLQISCFDVKSLKIGPFYTFSSSPSPSPSPFRTFRSFPLDEQIAVHILLITLNQCTAKLSFAWIWNDALRQKYVWLLEICMFDCKLCFLFKENTPLRNLRRYFMC